MSTCWRWRIGNNWRERRIRWTDNSYLTLICSKILKKWRKSFALLYNKRIFQLSDQNVLDRSEILKRKEQATLSQKRSFLVRMVSDPKCYNPKIVRHLTMSGFRKMNEDVIRDLSLRLFIYTMDISIMEAEIRLIHFN